MTPWRRRLRRLRIALTVGCACLIILAAVLVGLLRLLLPQVGLYPQRVAAFLSEQLQRPVSVDQVEGYWGDGGPLLRLEGVHVAAADPAAPPLVIPQAELGLDLGAWLGSHRRWSEFRIRGLDLTLQHQENGSWQVSGLVGGDGGGSGDNPLLLLGALVLRDSRLRVIDAANAVDIAVQIGELRLLNDGDDHSLRALLRRDAADAGRLLLMADFNSARRSGQVYLGGEALDLAGLSQGLAWRGQQLRAGKGRLQLWARLDNGQASSAHASFDLAGIEITPLAAGEPPAPGAGLAQLAGVARWQRDGAGWNLDLAGLRAAQAGSNAVPTALQLRRDDAGYRLQAEQVDLSTVAALLPLLPEQRGSWPARAGLQGQLRNIHLRYAAKEDFDLDAELAGLSFLAVDKVPGLTRLSGSLSADAGALVLELPPQTTTLNYLRKFRQPLPLQRLAGRIAAFPLESGWRVETDALDVDGPGYAVQLRGGVELLPDAGKPVLDLYAVVLPSDVPAAKQFWPIGDMAPRAMEWLDRALVAGTIVGGRAAIHCDLDDWPIRNYAGQFKARAEIEGLTLDYNPRWTRAENVAVAAEFLNSSMKAEVSTGTVLGAKIVHAAADIPSFKDAVLALDVAGEGSGPDLVAIITASPLGTRFASQLKGLEIGGSAAVKFRLDLPLSPNRDDSTTRGEVELRDARIRAQKWDIDFAHSSGSIRFNDGGFSAGPLRLEHGGQPAQFWLAVGEDVADKRNAAEARLQGNFPLDLVFAGAQALKPWWERASGRSEWTADLAVPREDGQPTRLTMRSELRGTALDLPAPLDKAAGDALPVALALQLPAEGSPLTVEVADVLRLRARLPDAQREFAGNLALGETMPEHVPASGLDVSGHGRRLDLAGWAAIGLGAGAGPGLLNAVDIRVAKASLGSRVLEDLGLVLARQPDQVGISFSGAQAQGTLQIPTSDLLKRGITAQFEHLYWPDAPRPPGAENADMPDPLDGVVPSTIPPLHLWIGDFRLGSAHLGETRLESLPSGEGMRIEQFETHSADMDMHVRGQWNGDGKRHRSDIDMDLTSENIGRMLTALGFSGLFDGGQTLAHLDAYWDGSPASFALARLEGKLKLNISAGRILDVEPGMGRLFGLFSVREIPRRLALDFGDFFRSGMSFTAISGDFALAGGNATTSNLLITSPAADIRIHGRTGLKARDYDQQMVVTPRVGGALTVVGALAGGPAGAAAGLAVQTLFNKAINQVTTARYHVTGSWDKPEITLVSREGGRRGSTPRGSPAETKTEPELHGPPAGDAQPIPPRPNDGG
ncbi:YhdP family protein [Tahibacter harae]|uniref:TIGR02099 family protein n=1 Tax=Tahibacter harae TaxID=2963937 RepID=A0ABT1QSN2_9GAMM|nr:TIGR02099 family protein [Tahibacter harae]